MTEPPPRQPLPHSFPALSAPVIAVKAWFTKLRPSMFTILKAELQGFYFFRRYVRRGEAQKLPEGKNKLSFIIKTSRTKPRDYKSSRTLPNLVIIFLKRDVKCLTTTLYSFYIDINNKLLTGKLHFAPCLVINGIKFPRIFHMNISNSMKLQGNMQDLSYHAPA